MKYNTKLKELVDSWNNQDKCDKIFVCTFLKILLIDYFSLFILTFFYIDLDKMNVQFTNYYYIYDIVVQSVKFILPCFVFGLFFHIANQNISNILVEYNIKIATMKILIRKLLLSVSYFCTFGYFYTLFYPKMFLSIEIKNYQNYYDIWGAICVILSYILVFSYLTAWSYLDE